MKDTSGNKNDDNNNNNIANTSSTTTSITTSMAKTISEGISKLCGGLQMGTWSRRRKNRSSVYSEMYLCVIVSCLLVGVCSATCNDSTGSNCTMAPNSRHNEKQASADKLQIQDTKMSSNTSEGQTGNPTSDFTDKSNVTVSTTGLQPNSSQADVEDLTTATGSKLDKKTKTNSSDLSTKGKSKIYAVKGDAQSQSGSDPEYSTEDESDGFNVVAIVIPFVSVILGAIIFCVVYKLCRRYKCCNNEECLRKCSAICDNCMTTPLVYQAPGGKMSHDQVSHISEKSHHQGVKSNHTQPSVIYRQPNGVPHPNGVHHSNGAVYSDGVHRGVSQRPVDNHRLSIRSSASSNSNHDLSRTPPRHDLHPSHALRQDSSRSNHSATALLAHQTNGHVERHGSGHHNVGRQNSGHVSKQGSARKVRHDSGASRSSQDSAQELLNPKGHHH